MKATPIPSPTTRRLFGWLGLGCLLLIIPVKAIRWTDPSMASLVMIGVAPSALGPAGLLFLLLSSSKTGLARFTLLEVTFLVGAIAVALEFAQLMPRPGILGKIKYTFDWLDVAGSLFSVSFGYLIARLLTHSEAWEGGYRK